VTFSFEIGQRVKVRKSGELGRVKRRDVEPTLSIPYYEVELDDGTVKRIAEKELWPQ